MKAAGLKNGDRVVEKGTDDEQQCPTCGGFGFVSDDDDHEEAIKTSPCRGRAEPAPSGTLRGERLFSSLLFALSRPSFR